MTVAIRLDDEIRRRGAAFAGAAVVGLAGLLLGDLLAGHRIVGLMAVLALHQLVEPILTAYILAIPF